MLLKKKDTNISININNINKRSNKITSNNNDINGKYTVIYLSYTLFD